MDTSPANAVAHIGETPPGSQPYFVPAPSVWPFLLTAALTVLVIGIGALLNEGSVVVRDVFLWGGLACVLAVTFTWFRGVARESERGDYSVQVDRTFRWGMTWFIFSEVMFFAAFFGALFYMRTYSLEWLSGNGAKGVANLLWPNFDYAWPTNGPAQLNGAFETVDAWGLPFLNTCLLLTSGVTITLAHHALKDNKRRACIFWMWCTVALGVAFLYAQVHEYMEAYGELNLTLKSGGYGSTFFMLTGFHGAHVTLGTLMLIVITLRLMFGHFTPDHHFGFEGVAWYWHFVDVVWLGLFIFVYIL